MSLKGDRRKIRRETIPEKTPFLMSIALIIPHPLHAIWATFSRREYVVISHCLKLSENYILLVEIGFRSFRMSLMVKLAPKNSQLDQYTLILRKFNCKKVWTTPKKRFFLGASSLRRISYSKGKYLAEEGVEEWRRKI